MAEMLVVDSLKELRNLIDQQHLLYLELDENPRKIEQRNKLESYIKDYLCLAPHDAKFTFHQTANVLHQSASTKNNFSAYKAAVAWKAIGKYADNLISHPWRKEYRDVKLYCGFYKHEIEASLVGAELMFEAMGYRHAGHSTMTLPGILDPDRITSVSKDAITAYVECQIMKQIWEMLSSHFNITWLEILEFRENHSGTPDQVIRTLTYKYRQRQYQEQIYHRPHVQAIDNHHHLPSECDYGQHMGYYDQAVYPGHTYSLPVQCRYNAVFSPQQMHPPSLYSNSLHPSHPSSRHILKPQDIYPPNGYHMHPHYPAQMGLHVPHNGYSIVPMMYSLPSIVPTGQLIELDPSPTHNGDAYSSRPNIPKFSSPQDDPLYHQDCLKNDRPNVSSKAKEDGAGSWESWDYVYRNLANQGLKKDHESVGDNLQYSSQNNSSDIGSIVQTDFSEKLRKINLDGNSQTQTDSSSSRSRVDLDEELKVKALREKSKIEVDRSKDYAKVKTEIKTSKLSPKKESVKSLELSSSSNSGYSKGNLSTKKDIEYPSTSREVLRSKKLKEEPKAVSVELDDTGDKWQCITCTYLNFPSNNVCEMCYKSRERGNELTPQPSGGAECPECTLVNEPGLSNCAACNASLKNSPTYI